MGPRRWRLHERRQADGANLSAGGGNDYDASPLPPHAWVTPTMPPRPPMPPHPEDCWSQHPGRLAGTVTAAPAGRTAAAQGQTDIVR
eukprot:COSAG01_NODE_707_length_14133_cov_34.324093_14_plen_87_part_00